jgi:CubicO group peptidase (beta-lactamase class C family)
MKKYLVVMLLLFASSGCSQFGVAVDAQDGYDEVITEQQSRLIYAESKDFPNQTQLSIAIIEGGVTKFYGVKRENDTLITVVNHESIFEIGSISKVFTATLLADFVMNQKLQLDHQIKDYLGWPLKDEVGITFKQLANHTSGLPRLPSNLILDSVDLLNPYKEYGEEKLRKYITEDLRLHRNPGEKFEYSNLGMGLLGYILSQMDTMAYENLLQARILGKYQMTATTTDRSKLGDKIVKGLNAYGFETPNWDLNVLVGAGGILSSVNDLSKFVYAQFDEKDTVLAMTRNPNIATGHQNMSVALGWMIRRKPNGIRLWHSGGTGGYSSSMMVDLTNDNAVIILSNVSGFNKKAGNIDTLCNRLIDTLEK